MKYMFKISERVLKSVEKLQEKKKKRKQWSAEKDALKRAKKDSLLSERDQ